ncbi:major allergen Can f 1-like [Suricata suricatta]|uniref:Lipocalin 1 n=1 Tax=Suricata suricatta TaxID=37032 RepID=A0A673U8Y9_SURSU|nr:major allergen Can f 1-like [Suricata suricatta]
MKALLLTVGLGLVAILQAQDPPASGGDTPDVSGKWYLKAMTSDQAMSEKLESVTPMTFTVLEGGDLNILITFQINGQCKKKTLVLKKTSEPGKYTAYEGKRVVYIKQAQVPDHYILYCEGEYHGQQIRMAKLVGRDPENNEKALEGFQKFSKAKGLLDQEIFIPKQIDTCSPGGDHEPQA